MKEYIDLNCGVPREAEKVGFKAMKASVAESADSNALRKAAKRHALINPSRVGDFHKDIGLIRAVAEGNAVFEIPLKPLLDAQFVYRSKHIALTRLFLRKCVKLRAGYVLTSRAESVYDLKSPREVIAIGQMLGLTREQADYAISVRPKKFLEALA